MREGGGEQTVDLKGGGQGPMPQDGGGRSYMHLYLVGEKKKELTCTIGGKKEFLRGETSRTHEGRRDGH